MSDERLHELGIPRRRFLKGTAAAAFVSPLVVSFALDGSAEARPGMANQACANMAITNQFLDLDSDLTQVIYWAIVGLRGCELNHGSASAIGHRALELAVAAAGSALNGPTNLCNGLSDLVAQIQRLPASGVRTQLLSNAQHAQGAAGCV